MRWKVAVVAVALAVVVVLAYMLWSGSSGGGVERIVVALNVTALHGGSVNPCGYYVFNFTNVNVIIVATPDSDYIFSYWLVNNTKVLSNPLNLTLRGNTTVIAYFKRVYFYVNITSDGVVLLNGSRIDTPYTIRYREKITLKLSGIRYLENNTIVKPLKYVVNGEEIKNTTLTLKLSYENATVELQYTREPVGSKILITSNHAPFCYLDNSTIELPATASGGLLYGNWSIYLNETHSWWLGWYTVTYRNGTTKHFSYYKYPAVMLNEEMEKVEIHYVLGLRGLPYVRRIWYFPPFRWNYSGKYWMCYARFEDYKIVFYNFTNPNLTDRFRTWARTEVIFEFDWNVSGVWLWFYPHGARVISPFNRTTNFRLKFMQFNSKMGYMPNMVDIVLTYATVPHYIYINSTYCEINDAWIDTSVREDLGFFDPSTMKPVRFPEMEGRYGLYFRTGLEIEKGKGDVFVVEVRILGVHP